MSYKLRFVQQFRQENAKEYLELEKLFVDLEKKAPGFPKGKRYLPVTGREPSNTLVWESEFETLKAAQDALTLIISDTRHEELFKKQAPYILGTYTEIYKPYDA
ncbi:MAG: hypothetical protein JNK79_07065 [Chitinophagaceae bacterium]|nr:hypothetical protein [Chitinophagaceae bacterium]